MSESSPRGALAGIRVLDCTHVLAGAWCSMLLADLGADVVKIEPPKGEVTRLQIGAFRAYDFVNRNKRAIAVDFSKPEGADALVRLATTADVWIENYRPGALERLGLGYEELRKRNPALIYASVSGFGTTGPYRERGGLDLVAQAMSGIMSFTGEPGGPPVAAGVPLADLNAGTFAALGILAAWAHRQKTGEGQRVETSLLESALAYTIWESGLFLTTGEVAKRKGSQHRLAAPYEALRTRDGHVVVGCPNQRLWVRFCNALGESVLTQDSRFATPLLRLANRTALRERIEARLAEDTTATWVEKIVAAGVPCGPINDISKALTDPQVRHRGTLVRLGERQFVGSPLKLSRTPPEVSRGPAEVGEHTREVLLQGGFSSEEIEQLIHSGSVVDGASNESH